MVDEDLLDEVEVGWTMLGMRRVYSFFISLVKVALMVDFSFSAASRLRMRIFTA